jgi:hypothetical protein
MLASLAMAPIALSVQQEVTSLSLDLLVVAGVKFVTPMLLKITLVHLHLQEIQYNVLVMRDTLAMDWFVFHVDKGLSNQRRDLHYALYVLLVIPRQHKLVFVYLHQTVIHSNVYVMQGILAMELIVLCVQQEVTNLSRDLHAVADVESVIPMQLKWVVV